MRKQKVKQSTIWHETHWLHDAEHDSLFCDFITKQMIKGIIIITIIEKPTKQMSRQSQMLGFQISYATMHEPADATVN